jgi:hypothetical protein
MDQHPLRKRRDEELTWRALPLAALLAVALAPGSGRASASVPGRSASAGEPSARLGERKMVVLAVTFRDAPMAPIGIDELRDLVFDAPEGMNAFFREASYENVWFSGEVRGWYELPIDCTKKEKILRAAVDAADADVFFPLYEHVLIYFPFVPGCEAGLPRGRSVPEPVTTDDGVVVMSVAWVPHGYAPGAPAHEVGHNLGLSHAQLKTCPHGTLDDRCAALEYGDDFDVMGGQRGHFSAYAKESLGWLTPQVVDNGGTFELAAIEAPTTAVQALKLPAPKEGRCAQWYYLEHRAATGFDAYIASYAPSVANGVLVHRGSACGGRSDLLSIAGVTGRFGEIESGGSGFLDGPAPMFVAVGPVQGDRIVVRLVPFGISRGIVNMAGTASFSGWVGSDIGWDPMHLGDGPWTLRLSDVHDETVSDFYTVSIAPLRCRARSCAGSASTVGGGLVSLALKRAPATWTFSVRISDRFSVDAPRGETIRMEVCAPHGDAPCVAGQFRFASAGGGVLRYRRRG